jgi:predicted permease
MPYFQDLGLSFRVIVFAGVLSLLVGFVLGIIPVLRMSSSETLAGLKEGSRGSASTMWRRAGAPLVVAELAIAMILLVSAGLLAKSLYRLLHVDTGFNVQQLAMLSVSPVSVPTGSPKKSEPTAALAQQVAERVAAVPGVVSVGYADLSPLAPGLAPTSTFWVSGRAEHDQLKEDWPVRRVSAGYFRTLQATVLRGREFTADDLASVRPVMIINDTAARRYFRSDDPIGRSIALGGSGSPLREIVGVVADIKDGPPESSPHPAAYVLLDQSAFTLVVRTAPAEHTVFPSIVAAVHDVQPGLSVSGQMTMSEQLHALPSTSLNRSSTWLVGGFASIAFVLAVVGLYGVVAYTVGQRTREIGVRMALGAQPRSVYRLVLGHAGRLASLGTVLGLVSAVGFATLMRHLLFDVESWDLATLAAASTGLVVSALLASYLPARRAASVNPVEVLRAE